jgi:hypothetical protein
MLLLLGLITSFFYIGCSKDSEIVNSGGNNNPQTKSKLEGLLLNEITNAPVSGAAILVIGLAQSLSTTTDANGKFSLEFIVNTTVNLYLIINKEDFIPDTLQVSASPGKNINLQVVELRPREVDIPSGDPVSIFLLSQSTNHIGVKESGAEETARLTFIVQDSSGRAIDLAHAVDVKFRFGARPNGGELLSPSVIRTNGLGQASVNLTSGTKSGVVQLIAEIQISNKLITSLPVAISIHGGLPNQNHFSLGPLKFNFPGLSVYGLENPISVIVGDKYSNPVKENTAVYFSTTGGIIEGSLLTNIQGRGSVNLISGNPIPVHPLFGPGFATITATTADENLMNISKETIVLFSGPPIISVTPMNFDLPNGGSQAFNFTVNDINGNPLAKDNTIKVTVEGGKIKAQGDIDVTMPDTQSRSWTQFNFFIYDDEHDVSELKPVTIKIEASGPNGGAFVTFSGFAR